MYVYELLAIHFYCPLINHANLYIMKYSTLIVTLLRLLTAKEGLTRKVEANAMTVGEQRNRLLNKCNERWAKRKDLK